MAPQPELFHRTKIFREHPIAIRRMALERYDPYHPLPIQQDDENAPTSRPPTRVSVLSLRRKTALWCLLAWILPYIMVDEYNVLPVAVFVYAMGIRYVGELVEDLHRETAVLRAMKQEFSERQTNHQERVRQEYKRIMFELQVLQGRRNFRLVSREEDGYTKFYSINNVRELQKSQGANLIE